MKSALNLLLPCDKHDTDAAEALVALGWEKLERVMPQILEWMQDINWPVAAIFRPFLVAQGARLAPCLKPIFASDDDIWKYNILSGIVLQSPELASAISAELERLVRSPTTGERQEYVTEQAEEILASWTGRPAADSSGQSAGPR